MTDKDIGILHLSDVHICKANSERVKKLVDLLKNDIHLLQEANKIKVRLVCITGDLINAGDNYNEELDLITDLLITPLMEFLGLSEESIFVVPGNHEVKRDTISPIVETGLEATLKTTESIDAFMNNIDPAAIQRIEYFDKDFSTLFGGIPKSSTPLMRTYLTPIDRLTIGITCVNSAWRSTGIGSAERGKMIVGSKQIIDGADTIESADLRICLMHHPIDWLNEADKISVERCINRYDIVLNGHIHESYVQQYTSFNGHTLFNTCGKFDDSNDIFNGYSLLSINPYNKNCRVFLRHYIGYPRNCYDKAIELAENGLFQVDLGNKDDNLALAYNITHSIKRSFVEYANSYFVSNVVSGKTEKGFEELFIRPEFSRHSEYEKETLFEDESNAQNQRITLDYICQTKNNILLLGKKEIGKTTVLHYLVKCIINNFNVLKSLPVIIDVRQIDYTGKEPILRATNRYVNRYCAEDDSFSVSEIERLIANGLCTFCFDNFEDANSSQLDKINAFIKRYPLNKYVFSEREFVSARSLRAIKNTPSCDYEEIHICSLTRGQIRAVATREASTGENSSLVDKIMICFKKTSLPKTPFALSLILSLCDSTDFSAINEAVVMEQFMEAVLEKTDPSEAYSTTFDFRTKEDFLTYLAAYMNEKKQFYLSKEEFEVVLKEYHSNVGFSISDTKFDSLFFEKGVLVRIEGDITFRYNCMIEYYLAKKADQSPDFLSNILSGNNYLNYANELMYYTGLHRRDLTVAEAIEGSLRTKFEAIRSSIPKMSEYDIGLEFDLPDEEFRKNIQESKLTQTESDWLQNTGDNSDSIIPEQLNKDQQYESIDAFFQTLFIYGDCLKNLELIPKSNKERIYSEYIQGLCVMLSALKQNTERNLGEKISGMESLPEKYSEKSIRRAKAVVQDILKIAIPLAIQNIALENIGTSKLSIIIKQNIDNASIDGFAKFFSVFLMCDLRLPGFKNVLKDYVQSIRDRSMLKIIMFKLMYYYQFRYFSSSLDTFLEDMLADINIRLNKSNKNVKSNLIQHYRDNRLTLTS